MKSCFLAVSLILSTGAAFAHGGNNDVYPNAPCEKNQRFPAWLAGVEKDARAAGVNASTWNGAIAEMTLNPDVVRRDRAQGVFNQTFLQFAKNATSSSRLSKGQSLMKKYKPMFDRIESVYGVPASVLVTFWALESDFHDSEMGNFPILSSMTTLAFDCRRPGFFRNELIHALLMIQRGDLPQERMIGAWAGELGGMQFTPSDYYKYGVDFDGDGHRDLVRSVPDMMTSSANFLVGLGWQRGEPWLQEVVVPENMPWQEADLAITHPRSRWAGWGVRAANGELPRDEKGASLLLPMGRLGPAFLAYPNFRPFLGWNAAMVYSTTVAYFASRFAGAPVLKPGRGEVIPLSNDQMKQLQRELQRLGYDIGGTIDGKLGASTRASVKKVQIRVGLPADSYPTGELLERLENLR